MSVMLAAFAAAFQLSAAPAKADWRPLGSTRGVAIEWDAANVERRETLIVRMRFTPPTPQPSAYAYAITRVEMRCTPAQAHAIETVNHRADGSPGPIDSVPVPFETIPEGSLFASLHRLVC